jgi:hypothetical protein
METKSDPSDHCYTILQDHGPHDGGWGPAAVLIPGIPGGPHPFIYTGSEQTTVDSLEAIVEGLARETGKPTILAKYTQREDVYVMDA